MPSRRATLHACEITKPIASADMKERLAGLEIEPTLGTPDQLAGVLKKQMTRWGAIVKASCAQLT